MPNEKLTRKEMVWVNQKFWVIILTEFPTGRAVWSEMLGRND